MSLGKVALNLVTVRCPKFAKVALQHNLIVDSRCNRIHHLAAGLLRRCFRHAGIPL